MICRLCLININVDTSVNIFNEAGNDGESKLVKIIAKYCHLEVTQQDEVSKAICQECHNHLTTFHKYCEFVEKQQSTLNNKFLVVEFDEQVITPNVVGAAELQESMDVQLKCEPEEELVAEAFAMRNDKDTASISSHSSEPSSGINIIPSSASEKRRKYREKLKKNSEKYAEHLRKERERNLARRAKRKMKLKENEELRKALRERVRDRVRACRERKRANAKLSKTVKKVENA